jgi:WD40 repeat protein
LNSLNLSSNIEKSNINNILPKENENKIIQTKESEESIGIESKNKYIKKYKSQNSRLYGITFQSSIESNLINVAVSSLNMNKNNNISILSFSQEDKFNDEDNINLYNLNNINRLNSINNNSIFLKSQIEMELPVSSILFSPHEQNKNLLMSASDILRLYSFDGENLSLKYEFKKRIKNYCGPISACDWSLANNSIVGVSSIDTTCSILDLNKLQARYMIIAHDKEVYDISLGQDEFTFMSTGADGSVRLFDSRSANTSSIIFETIDKSDTVSIFFS